ncbi:MAG: hypothetical protein IT416_02740 [Candidatus Pacebacteria bacterium]|nr:hypothetical protein [Candidatus Paceibacterota bacterium]
MSRRNLPKVVEEVYKTLEKVKENPEEWLTDVASQLIFVAGGGLPLTFGSNDSKIWQALTVQAAENNGIVKVAEIDFSLRELSLLGEFYRGIRGDGYSLHCIDERLKDDLESINKQVHERCGACAAIQAVVGDRLAGDQVEDLLLVELGEEVFGKQAIDDSMPEHDSLSVFIDFHGDEAITDKVKRANLKNKHALVFQVSLPVKVISRFLEFRNEDQDLLLSALVKWNIQIARNIIGCGHNKFQKYSKETIFILDEREVADNQLISRLQQLISDVDHKKELIIK